jgi:hypothetical protein
LRQGAVQAFRDLQTFWWWVVVVKMKDLEKMLDGIDIRAGEISPIIDPRA